MLELPRLPHSSALLCLPSPGALVAWCTRMHPLPPARGALLPVQAYLAEWAALPPSVQAGEWQVLKEYIKTDDIASLEVHLRAMI